MTKPTTSTCKSNILDVLININASSRNIAATMSTAEIGSQHTYRPGVDEVVVESDYAYTYRLSDATGYNTPKVQLIIPAKVSIKKKIAKLQELDHVVFALQLK